MSQIKDKKKIVADIGTNLEYKTNRINPSQIMNIITDGANPYQSLDSPNWGMFKSSSLNITV